MKWHSKNLSMKRSLKKPKMGENVEEMLLKKMPKKVAPRKRLKKAASKQSLRRAAPRESAKKTP